MLDTQSSFDAPLADSAFPLDPEDLAALIGIPLADWPGNCHGIAEAVLRRAPVDGMRLTRGHWHGYISRNSIFGARDFTQHSWLVLADGRILDPTRWTLEDPKRPAIYLGVNDHYDEAGLQLRQQQPPVFFNAPPNPFQILLARIPQELCHALSSALGSDHTPGTTDPEHRWLADALARAMKSDPDRLHDADRLYSLMAEAGMQAMIPIDLWRRVMEPEVLMHRGANRSYTLPAAPALRAIEVFFDLMTAFVCIEERELQLEEELAEIGYTLDDLHSALNALDDLLKSCPEMEIEAVPRFYLDSLCVIAGDILGKGFGTALRVERRAASRGYRVTDLDALMRRIGARVGYDLSWD